MNRKYNENPTEEQKNATWDRFHPNNKINSEGRDNSGKNIDYDAKLCADEIKKRLSTISKMIKL